MKKLLSLPPNLVNSFHDIAHVEPSEYFCTSDPVGSKLGSGGGTTWLLQACMEQEQKQEVSEWLAQEKRILLHAGQTILPTVCFIRHNDNVPTF